MKAMESITDRPNSENANSNKGAVYLGASWDVNAARRVPDPQLVLANALMKVAEALTIHAVAIDKLAESQIMPEPEGPQEDGPFGSLSERIIAGGIR